MSRLILTWTALLLAVPAFGADRTDNKTTAREASTSEAQAIHAEMIAFGQWMIRLDAATTEAIAAFRDVGPSWNAAMATGSPDAMEARFRPTLARVEAAIGTARARLDALDTPSFPRLRLPVDTEPVRLRAEMQRMIGNMADIAQTLPGVMTAMRARDPSATRLAMVKMLDTTRALFRAQAALTAAWAATTEADDPTLQSLRFELLFFKSGVRLLDSVERGALGKPDPTLGADLRGIAGEIDAVVTAGNKLVDAQRAEFTASREELAGEKDPESVSARAMADKVVAMSGLQQEGFAVSQRYAAQLRRTADAAGSGPVSMTVLGPMIDSLRTTRTELDEIGMRVAQVMAGTK
ncbi:MAG TPA: hypothetical protein VLG14_14470 [Sphingomonas sp.]|jgi:hypothetical protein|nr:hypothetical protein [Sphingomonas sp.]